MIDLELPIQIDSRHQKRHKNQDPKSDTLDLKSTRMLHLGFL